MQLLKGNGPVGEKFHHAVVAIGNFDGLHRGHQELLRVAASAAQARGVPWGIVTFDPHPRSFFKPGEPVFTLTPTALKARLAAALGASFVVSLEFNRELAALQPEEFIAQYLVNHMAVAHVVTGYDFHFGKGRKGSPITLREAGPASGFSVTIVEQVSDEGDGHSPFSSSAIRANLRHGHLAQAARELGYHWTVMGEVVRGDGRGRGLGFPTANIQLEPGAEPWRGIYAVRVRDTQDQIFHGGAGYFGDRPTFATTRNFLEVFLFDFNQDIYGRTLLVEFIELIRPDRKFNGTADLQAQMRDDCEKAKLILQALRENDPCTSFPLGLAQQQGLI